MRRLASASLPPWRAVTTVWTATPSGKSAKAYNAIAKGEGLKADCAVEALEKSYVTKDEDGKFITDEFVVPTVLGGL